MARILVLVAHPQLRQSRVNRALLKQLKQLQSEVSDALAVRDLYALYPDYSIDVEVEQSVLNDVDVIVWQHPIHWYSMPALMKLWVDEVLTLGWAYGQNGTALKNKHFWLVATTGGSAEAYQPHGYNRHAFDEFLPAYRQTAALCGMQWLKPSILHGAHQASQAAVDEHVNHVVEKIRALISSPSTATIDAVPSTHPAIAAVLDTDRPQRSI